MRMRKKKHSAERIEACADYLLKDPINCFGHENEIFGKKLPMLLEIGCGKGDFACGLSKQFPDHGIIALERVPDVAMLALEKAVSSSSERPDNLRVVIGNAEFLTDWFSPHTFQCIYANFSDPWPKKGQHKRRLTAPSFLSMYEKLLVPGGEFRFKTDNEDLFDWSVEQFKAYGLEMLFYTRDLHQSELADTNIITEYERRFTALGMKIFSAHVRFPVKEESDV